jgi:hypothetical protein
MIQRTNGLQRLKTLRQVGAPKWIIQNEKLHLADARYHFSSEQYEEALNKFVRPYMDGKGYITV